MNSKAYITSSIISIFLIITTVLIVNNLNKLDYLYINKTTTVWEFSLMKWEFQKERIMHENQIISELLYLCTSSDNETQIKELLSDSVNTIKSIDFNDSGIITSYQKQFEYQNTRVTSNTTINGTVILNYPFRSLMLESWKFNETSFQNCLKPCDCSDFKEKLRNCLNNISSEAVWNYDKEICYGNQIDLQIIISIRNDTLSSVFPHKLRNSTFTFYCD